MSTWQVDTGLVQSSENHGLANVPVTVLVPLMVVVQLAVPEQPPPDQPVKREPVFGVAVSVMVVPGVS